jgi:hypothetical protein
MRVSGQQMRRVFGRLANFYAAAKPLPAHVIFAVPRNFPAGGAKKKCAPSGARLAAAPPGRAIARRVA